MKRHITKLLLIAALTAAATAPGRATPATEPDNYLLMPLIFERQQWQQHDTTAPPQNHGGLKVDDQWVRDAASRRARAAQSRYLTMIDQPQLVRYTADSLPQPPKEVLVKADPSTAALQVGADTLSAPQAPVIVEEVKIHNWLHTFSASLHFTQAYMSDNWYQGGENNFNILGDVQWDVNLNQNVHPRWLFNNSLHYKLGVSTSKGDKMHKYHMNEDLFQFSSQLGYKAVKHWYYSANLLFKTQFFNNYKVNSSDLTASFLSPGELTLGLGMTYNYKDKDEAKNFTLAISPLSYNMKICRDITRLDPTTFGIKAGHHTKHDIGSSLEAKLLWKITANIVWTSRFYVFTNYHYAQGDWENTFDFTINKYLSTKIFAHLRYDNSAPRDASWRYWQFKEILSFGIVYRFATN